MKPEHPISSARIMLLAIENLPWPGSDSGEHNRYIDTVRYLAEVGGRLVEMDDRSIKQGEELLRRSMHQYDAIKDVVDRGRLDPGLGEEIKSFLGVIG